MIEIQLNKTSLLELLKGREVRVGSDTVVKGYGLDVRFEYFGKTGIGCQVDKNGNDMPKGDPEIRGLYTKAKEIGHPIRSENL